MNNKGLQVAPPEQVHLLYILLQTGDAPGIINKSIVLYD